MHAVMMQSKPWVIEKDGHLLKIRFQTQVEHKGARFALSRRDLEGWAIPISSDQRVVASFGESTWEMPRVEARGEIYAEIPWSRISLLDELDKARALV